MYGNPFFGENKSLFDWKEPDGGGIGYPKYLGDDGAIRFCETLIKDFGLMLLPSSVYQSELTQLSNDYFKTLLDMSVQWKPNGTGNSFEASDRSSGDVVRSATRADLVFGSNSQLRAICEVYASDDANEKFTSDFISAWNKVMNNDLF